jgi:hypothetical protein
MTDPRITDLSGLGPQRTFLQSRPDVPNAASTLYIERFTTRNADQTESHLVAGVHVVLGPDEPNGLWKALHVDRASAALDPRNPRVATRSLHVCCDTLEVRGRFCVPEADVAVFARRVVWATADAAIDTSPLAWSNDRAADANREASTAAGNGAHGRNAGKIRFFAAGMEFPAGDGRKRLLADGGAGQHPGAGADGRNGDDRRSMTRETWSVTEKISKAVSKATVSFSPPAVYVAAEWRWVGVKMGNANRGSDEFPTSGTDALAPGLPGNAGDAGELETNLPAAAALLSSTAGHAGATARDCRGGSAGSPSPAAKYSLTMRVDTFGTDDAGYDLKETGRVETTPGKGATAQAAKKEAGKSPQPVIVAHAGAWLHPLGLQQALEYARDLFLADARAELRALLAAYEAALALPVPATGAWAGEEHEALWTASQAEIASMQQRLDANLDYFGHPAGYMPLLSLQGAVALYAEETRRALGTLLLASAVQAKEHDTKQAEAALAQSITVLNQETREAATRIVAAEAKAGALDGRIAALTSQLGALANELAALRTTLLNEAQNDLERQARIRFGIRMAAAICQVIPVGQPVLGTVGSLVGATADMIGKDPGDGLPDTLSAMSDVLDKAGKAKGKAKDTKEKASAAAADGADAGDTEGKDDKAKAKKGASAWATVGKGLGPALSQASRAVAALKVPKAEVEAELEKLESASPRWRETTARIRELNDAKAALFAELADALQALGEGYALISSNAAAVVSMHQARSGELARLDPAATAYVRQMGQRSRLTLLKYLYLVVRSYETTVFRPIQVDWKLAEITARIAKLVQPKNGYDTGTLKAQADDLAPLFEANLDRVRDRLLGEFSFGENTAPLRLPLSAEQTPELIAALNATGRVVLDPLAFGLLLPDTHLARLRGVVLKRLEFDPKGPQLPTTTNLVVTLQPSRGGTVRRGEQLYAVHSDEPMRWSWTRLEGGEMQPAVPSEAAKDMLDLVLGTRGAKIRQKVALPPLWSELAVKVAFSPELPRATRPRITSLYFEMSCDTSRAPEDQRVVTLRAEGVRPGVVIACAPGDLGGRGDALDGGMRIYSAGAKVRLSVPERAGEAAFRAWDVVGVSFERMDVHERGVDVPLDGHVLALCRWTVPAPAPRRLKVGHIAPPQAEGARVDRGPGAASEPPGALAIRSGADPASPVVGVAPSLSAAEVMEEGDGEWTLVNYRGIVGWVAAAPEPALVAADG